VDDTLFDSEAGAFLYGVYERADAFLFGRRTYEIVAGYWGIMDPGEHAIAKALNTRPKYVASTTLTDPRWAGTTVLSGEVATAIDELRSKPGGELQVHGSGALIRWLLGNDLVDEMNLFTVRWSSARARGSSQTPARTGRSNCPSCR
jgi:dihydrofolate reductase